MNQLLNKSVFTIILTLIFLQQSAVVSSGGWDLDKGPQITMIKGELVCIGCALKGKSGSNSQCGIYTSHNIGLSMADGSLWHFVNNQTGHDIIFAHNLLDSKKATITGFMYPKSHMIEIVSIIVEEISDEQISDAAFNEDKMIGKALLNRKKGEPPLILHYEMSQ